MRRRPPRGGARYVFVGTEGFPPTVYTSQVAGLLNVLARDGLAFEVVAFDPLLPLTAATREGRRRAREFRQHLPAGTPVRLLPYVPFEDRVGLPLARRLLGWALRGRRATVVHARALWAAAAALEVARERPWIRVVYDVRGDYEAEHNFHHTGDGSQPAPGLERIRRTEAAVCARADAVLSVSQVLADVLAARCPGAAAKTVVIPNGHDPAWFRVDAEARERVRARHGLGDAPVVVYAGSRVPHQRFPWALQVALAAREVEPGARLLLLTPEPAQAAEAAAAAGFPRAGITSLRVAHREVPAYLNAADLAVLCRVRDPVTAASSPVKLAEYLACGLPVVTHPGIGDTAPWVEEAGGAVLAEPVTGPALTAALTRLLRQPPPRAQAAAVAARLERSRFLPTYRELYGGCAERARAALTRGR